MKNHKKERKKGMGGGRKEEKKEKEREGRTEEKKIVRPRPGGVYLVLGWMRQESQGLRQPGL